MTELETSWASILAEGRTEPGWHARRIRAKSPCDLRAAIREPDRRPALLVCVPARSIPSGIEYPSCIGFTLQPEPMAPGPGGTVQLCLVLGEVRFRDLFSVLAEDVANVVAGASSDAEALRRLTGRLNSWQRFVTENGTDTLSEESRVGLFAEIMFLEAHVLPVLPPGEAVASWRGPLAAPHDFELPGRSFEIKATTAANPVTFRVSNLDQLAPTHGRPLELVYLVLDGAALAGSTLPELVERVRATLADSDPSAALDFDARLLAVGYTDAHSRHYADFRYQCRLERWFSVSADFPRLTRGTVPSGIADSCYTVRLADCSPFEMTPGLTPDALAEIAA